MKLITAAAAIAVLATPALADMDAAKALIAKHSQLPEFTAPG